MLPQFLQSRPATGKIQILQNTKKFPCFKLSICKYVIQWRKSILIWFIILQHASFYNKRHNSRKCLQVIKIITMHLLQRSCHGPFEWLNSLTLDWSQLRTFSLATTSKAVNRYKSRNDFKSFKLIKLWKMTKQWWWSNLKCQQFIHSYTCICTIKSTTILDDEKYHIIYINIQHWSDWKL